MGCQPVLIWEKFEGLDRANRRRLRNGKKKANREKHERLEKTDSHARGEFLDNHISDREKKARRRGEDHGLAMRGESGRWAFCTNPTPAVASAAAPSKRMSMDSGRVIIESKGTSRVFNANSGAPTERSPRSSAYTAKILPPNNATPARTAASAAPESQVPGKIKNSVSDHAAMVSLDTDITFHEDAPRSIARFMPSAPAVVI